MISRTRLCVRGRDAFPLIGILSVIFIVYNFPTTLSNKSRGRTPQSHQQHTLRVVGVKPADKPNQIHHAHDFVPDFKHDVDISELSAWGYQPKETWHDHYQKLFRQYNMTWTDKSYPELKCNATFESTLMENMDVISKYPFQIPKKYLEELSLDNNGIDELSKVVVDPKKYPVFVTASSSNHYKESIGLIQTFHQLLNVHPELTMIYYDIGLSGEQREELEQYCKCELRTFDSGKYPPHIASKKGYAWKPVIIQTVLKEYDFVMWMDASIRFNGNPLDEVCLRSRQRGIQGMHGWGAICERTSKNSFEFLHEAPCLFNLPEVEATWLSISRNRFTLEYIMKPWVSCALSYNCMVDKGSASISCRGSRKYHKCHRFDQSILGIIVNRLFHEKRRVVEFDVAPIFNVKRGHNSNYFEELKKQL